MATVAEIKELKRAELDALAVEQGIDPKAPEFSKAEDLRTELLKTATDAEEPDETDEDDEEAADDAEQATTTTSADQVANDAETAADAAETPVEAPVATGSSSHASSFDKNGQPIFGKAPKAKK